MPGEEIADKSDNSMAAPPPTKQVFNAPDLEPASPRWWVPVLLAIPALIPLVNSLVVARARGLVATGFIQIDQPYYVADARKYFDEGFHFLYGNPYAGYDTPRIYFQPHLFLLGCFQQLGLDPGVTWVFFSMVGDHGYYAWLYEPATSDGLPKLQRHANLECKRLNVEALEDIIRSVDRYYEALSKSLIV